MKKNEKQEEMISWYDQPNFITTLIITVLVTIIILSQSFAIKNNLDTNDILRSLLNHNSIYILGLIYFIPLKTLSGKKYFNYLNVFLTLIYSLFTITGVLTVIQSFGLNSLVNLFLNAIFLIYMMHTLLKNTKIWKEMKLEKSPLDEIGSINYFYTIVVISIILLAINLIETSTLAGAIIALLICIYTSLFSRYLYLYSMHLEKLKKKGDK